MATRQSIPVVRIRLNRKPASLPTCYGTSVDIGALWLSVAYSIRLPMRATRMSQLTMQAEDGM